MPFPDMSTPCGSDHSVGQRAGKERLDKTMMNIQKPEIFSADIPPPNMLTNYVLIDFENVHPDGLEALLANECFRIIVFLGANQQKVAFDLAAALQPFGSRAEYVKISGNGPNALDFHIAYYIGHLAATNTSCFFHIISKDTGFDPLIKHLQKKRRFFTARHQSIADIPLVKNHNAKSPSERAELVVKKLLQLKAGKPRTVKTLDNVITAAFLKQLSPEEITAVREALVKTGHISITGTKVSYPLPGNATSSGQSSRPEVK